MCNSRSKVFFWDLSRLEAYHEYIASLTKPLTAAESGLAVNTTTVLNQYSWLPLKKDKRLTNARGVSPIESVTSSANSSVNMTSIETVLTNEELLANKAIWDKKYSMGDPLRALEAHRHENVPRVLFTGRQVAWSMDGEWCVVTGSEGVVAVFGRWGENGGKREKRKRDTMS
jgi:polycomb protein EED